MISRAAAYHSGFNAGYNIAEAVNFALAFGLKIYAESAICVLSKVRLACQYPNCLKSLHFKKMFYHR